MQFQMCRNPGLITSSFNVVSHIHTTLMRCSHAAPVGSSSDQTERVWCYCWADGTSFLNGSNVDTVTWLLFSNDIIYSRFVLKIVRIMWLWIRMDLNPPWKLGVEDNYYTTGRPDVRWCLVLQLNKCWDIPDQQNLSVYINFQCCNVSTGRMSLFKPVMLWCFSSAGGGLPLLSMFLRPWFPWKCAGNPRSTIKSWLLSQQQKDFRHGASLGWLLFAFSFSFLLKLATRSSEELRFDFVMMVDQAVTWLGHNVSARFLSQSLVCIYSDALMPPVSDIKS